LIALSEKVLYLLYFGTDNKILLLQTMPGTDVMIFKMFSPKKSAEKIGVFDQRQS
jgi:hypothetical protein